jgi:hypothetical protein
LSKLPDESSQEDTVSMSEQNRGEPTIDVASVLLKGLTRRLTVAWQFGAASLRFVQIFGLAHR